MKNSGEIKRVKIGEIKVGERFRKEYPKLDQLAASLETYGFIQPLYVDEEYNLIAGGRRLQAAKVAGLQEVPVIVGGEISELESKELELEENLQREDLTWQEEVEAKREIDRIKKALHGDKVADRSKTGWSLRETASLLGESVGAVSQDIQLAEALEAFPELAECKNKKEADKLFRKIVGGLARQEVIKRLDKQGKGAYKFAKSHYNVGDAIEGLKELDQTVASFAEVDPPYGVRLGETKKTHRINMREYTEVDRDEYLPFIETVARELYRVLADSAWVVWWFGIEYYKEIYTILTKVGFSVDRIPAIWAKNRPGQTQHPDMYLGRSYETFFTARKGNIALAKPSTPNVFTFPPVAPQRKIHPTERPIELMEALLDTFTYPGTVAIVPFLGSGVTLRALYKKGMTGFGWDLEEENKKKFLIQVAKDEEEGLYEHDERNGE